MVIDLPTPVPSPADLPLEETLRWLETTLPPAPARLLEVGAGDGALAARLQAMGFAVTAIDRDPAAVEAAREREVTVIEKDVLDFEDDPFDAVLFTRSLHHIEALDAAVERAAALLAPDGVLAVEEFAIDRVDGAALKWLDDLERTFEAAGLVPASAPTRAAERLREWSRRHREAHELHGGDAMLAALGSCLILIGVEEEAYLYRTLCPRLEPTERGAKVAFQALQQERRNIQDGVFQPAGLRVIGRRTD